MTEPASEKPEKPSLIVYGLVGTVCALFVTLLVWITAQPAQAAVDPRALLRPIFALVAWTALITLLMALSRNIAVMIGRASTAYYADYKPDTAPTDWIERPARTFNNLMQLPTLFYVACMLMLVTETFDRAQIGLAWVFVATRVVHAVIYIAVNYVPARFTAWLCGAIVLFVLWARFAMQTGV